MSDPAQPPPPKPKPGSLRDRIAAFEKPSNTATAAPARPPVRPKPGNVSWKPAPPSPTSTVSATPDNEEQKRGGMSASDAKESIGRGGSLKERMALLQGKGAFGGGPPPAPPTVGPKPMKRPPLVVPSPPADEEAENERTQDEPKPDEEEGNVQRMGTAAETTAEGDAVSPKEDKDEPAEEEQDEEAKERERRAAIAARMARLGGARVGMAPPPILGKKPEVKPKPKEVEQKVELTEQHKETISSPEDKGPVLEPVRRDSAASEVSATSEEKHISHSQDKEDSKTEILPTIVDEEVTPKESGTQASQPSLSTATSPSESRPTPDLSSSYSSGPTSRSPPTSMPLPTAPRRAGPPRSRSARNIKAQGPSQEEAATEVPPVPSEAQTEPVASSETEPEAEVIIVKEESAHYEATSPTKPSILEAKANEEHAATVEISEDPPVPSSPLVFVQGEGPVSEPSKSHENVPPEENQEREPENLTVSGVDVDSPSKPMVDDEVHASITSTLEQQISERPEFELGTERAPEVHDPPATAVASISEDPMIDELLPQADEEHMNLTIAEQTPIQSAAVEQSPSSPLVAEPEISESGDFLGNISAKQEPEQPQAEGETEDEEASRRKRIAERMAKMGGRNPLAASPFGLGATPRKASVDEPQEAASAPEHEELQEPQKVTYEDDVSHEREVITEHTVASDSHEVEDLGPRLTSVAEEQKQDKDVPIAGAPLDEHEETGPKHKISTELLTPSSEDHPALVSPPERSSSIEDADEMAPPRITRSIPPPPPEAHVEDRAASPTATELKHHSVGRSVPPPPQESTPITLHHAHDAFAVEEEDELGSNPESPRSDHMDASATALPSSPSGNEHQGDTVTSSPEQIPKSRRSIPPPPRTVPVIPPTAVSPTSQSPTSAVSGTSRRSIPPPVPRALSPTSIRRATSPPARPPPVSPPRSVSPEVEIALSPTASMKRSIPPPRRAPSNPVEEAAGVPPVDKSSQAAGETVLPPARRSSSPPGGSFSPRSDGDGKAAVSNRDSIEEQEVLDDSEPDPIDPSFYSPPRTPVVTSRIQASLLSHSTEASSGDGTEEDGEQARRRTIAERMAKLGGIKFGAPPPVPPVRRRTTMDASETPTKESPQEDDGAAEDVGEDTQGAESEEAERARRQAISARLAGMGGMRFGMLPQISTTVHPRTRSDESARTAEAPSTQQPPLDQLQKSTTSDADLESEDGVKVEAESETSIEEVTEEDAVEEPEEIPPPIPFRQSRQSYEEIAPPLPGGRRPPIRTSSQPSRPPVPSTETNRSRSIRKTSGGEAMVPAPPHSSEFVVVGDPLEQEEMPPPPPPRAARPPRSIPPPAPPPPAVSSTSPTRDMGSSQWELPDIPTGSFDLNVGSGSLGLDSSFASEDSTSYPSTSSHPPPGPAPRPESTATPTPAAPRAEVQLSADELLQLWGTVGTAVHTAASTLFDKSKKTLIGDGTSQGFVTAALVQVPQASRTSYGHLVYSQNGHAVLRRSSNIMPGDIIQLTEAKLKGHKGLQSYHQTVGTAKEPFVAIVSEFEAKRSKVKVFQANQHVGAQTVETASYRLDDLKSGNIKVFRVASA